MSSSNLRDQLNDEVLTELFKRKELKPFIPAWNVIKDRFQGINDIDSTLDPVTEVHCQLMKELSTNGLITEELFFSWLLNLKFIGKNIVCKSSGQVWEPLIEPLYTFLGRSGHEVTVSDVISYDERINKFNMWVIQLCDWDGLVVKSAQYH